MEIMADREPSDLKRMNMPTCLMFIRHESSREPLANPRREVHPRKHSRVPHSPAVGVREIMSLLIVSVCSLTKSPVTDELYIDRSHEIRE